MSLPPPKDNVNFYITVALIAGIIAVLGFSIYYEIQLSAGSSNDKVTIPVVTVTATVIVVVPASTSTSCTNNETSSEGTATPC